MPVPGFRLEADKGLGEIQFWADVLLVDNANSSTTEQFKGLRSFLLMD